MISTARLRGALRAGTLGLSFAGFPGFSRRASTLAISGGLVLASCLTACKDPGKESEARAKEHVQSLVTLAEKDVAEVERGLPEGAKRLGPQFAKEEPQKNLPAVRSALQKVRRDVPDLLIAKSTFFAFADENGVAVRNDLEQDVMAGQNLFQIFPDLAKSKDAFVSTTGSFPGATSKAGPDKDWIAAAPVRKEDGKLLGVFVTGWAYRRFSNHLAETLKHDLQEALMASDQKGKMPVIYVGLFDKSGAYGAPQTPAANEKALADLDLVGKTSAGTASGTVVITERTFGWAAARAPKLGSEVGIFVLRSEI